MTPPARSLKQLRDAGVKPERIAFFVPGLPRSTQTGTVVRVGHRSVPLRRGSAWSTYAGLVAMQHRPPMPLEGPLSVDLLILFPRPKSAKPRHIPGRVDVENAAKGLLDAFQGVLYMNDRQICDLVLRKRYAQQPGVRVEVQTMPEDWSPEYRP